LSADNGSLRIDLLLCRLRFVKTRGLALRMLASSHMRCNGAHVVRASHAVRPGDVLTFAIGDDVRIVEIVALPDRRGPAPEAAAHYRLLQRGLDRGGQTAIAPAAEPSRLKDPGT
jgi:ribosome-associated heat shock protein Hsp15